VQPAPAPRFSRTAASAPSPPALPGDHTLALLDELDLERAELVGAGVVRQSRAR
jgi:alpha-methylacyl-CoA racemase